MRDRIGVLGSLCNPPHVGHVALARAAAAQLELARVLLVPTGAPSHRPAPAEGPDVRWRLAEAAAADEPVFVASRVEVDRPGPSYMADTLLELAPLGELVLLLGSDQHATLDTWHEPALVRARCRIAVAERPGTPLPPGDHETIAMDPIDVSSSEVRRCVAAGEPIGGLVTPSVEALIHGEGLYR